MNLKDQHLESINEPLLVTLEYVLDAQNCLKSDTLDKFIQIMYEKFIKNIIIIYICNTKVLLLRGNIWNKKIICINKTVESTKKIIARSLLFK